ncbi:MAG: hypothetical protein V4622_06065 [Bacteroidota bacterium]
MKKYILIYSISVLVIATIFFVFPINLFDGEIHYKYDLVDYNVKQKLSLSYFVGIGANPSEIKGVKDFYLLPLGYVIALLMIFVLPAIITYRISLKKKQ